MAENHGVLGAVNDDVPGHQTTQSVPQLNHAVVSPIQTDGLDDKAQLQQRSVDRADAQHEQDDSTIRTSTNSSTGLSVRRLLLSHAQTIADSNKVDTDDSDAESALGDMSLASSSVSATSSVFKFVEKYGRTFHSYKEGSELPNVSFT